MSCFEQTLSTFQQSLQFTLAYFFLNGGKVKFNFFIT